MGLQALAPPQTPTKWRPEEELKETFLRISENYNLGLVLSDKPQSPSRTRQDGTQGDIIYWRRFRPVVFSDDLPRALAAFRDEAIAVSQGWIHKPLADQDALPLVTGLPSASSEQERCELIDLLEQVLSRYAKRTPVSSFNSKFGDSAPIDRTPSKRPHPRDHVVIPKSPPKKARSSSDTSEGHVSIPDKEGAVAIAESPADIIERLDPLKRTSAHSSRDSFRTADAVFSQKVPLSQDTVTTIEASSQEKKRLPPPAPSTQDSFPASSDFELKMLESFYDEGSDQPCLPGSDSSDLDYSDIGQSTLAELEKSASKVKVRHASAATIEFETLLNNVWPAVPDCLSKAPLPIVWEILRVCLFAGVDTRGIQFSYEESWVDQDVLWRVLKSHPLLRVKTLPERSRAEAWTAAFDNFQTLHRVVVFTASLEFSSSSDRGSVFTLQLDPLRLERPHRLNRRFGSDRFMEIIIPTLDAKNLPSHFKNFREAECILRSWASQRLHYFIGRAWSGFFIRPYRNTSKEAAKEQKDQKDFLFHPVHHVSMKHRFYLFAEDGDDFSPSLAGQLPSKGEPFTAHTRATKWEMIEWLLQISKNMDQPVTKLFSRIVLGLSRTDATVVLEKSQIKIRKRDRLSPTGNVMNDGIGRISQSLARKIRAKMGSSGNLTGFQGRIGSAKGFWIIDIQDDTDRDWIILYPSQRKWKCDFTDEEHRTFEVRSEVNPLKSANLNNQFLPILHDRAKDKKGMKIAISNILERSLCKEMEEQRMAIQDPCRLRLWVQNNSTGSLREARLKSGQVPFVGGLPKQEADRINFLLDGGFDPRRLRMLWELTFKLRKDRCEEMKSRMNIRIGRSTYAFMVVDFWGLLNEGEIHLGFSSNFQDDDSRFSETYLHGMDVLVARSPAHYTSDIQKVKAVFRPELGPLKDVVVFPSKGNIALADKLSGGDYDGDIAWVCWDPDIVGNFANTDVPACPDLFREGVLTKQTETYNDLALQHGTEASSKFFDAAFQFNMQPSLLGLCTNFKERLGYQRRAVGDEAAVRLSTLLSNLVDQAKQGIQFTNTDWTKFRNRLLEGKAEPPQPRYKSDSCPGIRKFPHIIDHLKFSVLIPIIERELAILSNDKTKPDSLLVPWDKDLVRLYDFYNELGQHKPRVKSILQKLVNDLDALYSRCMDNQAQWKDVPFEIKMARLYEDFHAIQPKRLSRTLERMLTRGGTGQYSEWSLLKASVMFKKFYMQGVTWWIAGRQLQHLKSLETTEGTPTGGALALVRPQIYAALRPDKSFIQALVLEDVVHSGGDIEEVEDSIDNDNEI